MAVSDNASELRFYKQAQVLVFDEATSALDTDTEQAVMDAIEGLSKELTIVMIAHRLSTVEAVIG